MNPERNAAKDAVCENTFFQMPLITSEQIPAGCILLLPERRERAPGVLESEEEWGERGVLIKLPPLTGALE